MSASDAPRSVRESAPARPFAHSRLYDLGFAGPVAVLYGFAIAGNGILIAHQWNQARDLNGHFAIANEVTTAMFFALQAFLFVFRRLPIAKTRDVWPRIAAVLGANFNLTLLLLPRIALNPAWASVSFGLTTAGTLGAVAVLAWLGRSFAVMPQARKFVSTGPYRFVRHPLYLAEIIAMFGIMLGFRQPWSALVVAATIALQFCRMGFEENLLAQTYPAYEVYRRKTARLVSGLY